MHSCSSLWDLSMFIIILLCISITLSWEIGHGQSWDWDYSRILLSSTVPLNHVPVHKKVIMYNNIVLINNLSSVLSQACLWLSNYTGKQCLCPCTCPHTGSQWFCGSACILKISWTWSRVNVTRQPAHWYSLDPLLTHLAALVVDCVAV